MVVKTLAAANIRADGLQMRKEVNEEHVLTLSSLFDAKSPAWPDGLPPVRVVFDGSGYYLWDGHHRFEGAKVAGCTEIRADVTKGTLVDAQKLAIGANEANGLRRTNEDKRFAVLRALELFPTLSDRDIAEMAKVSQPMVSSFIRDYCGGHRPAAVEKISIYKLVWKGITQRDYVNEEHVGRMAKLFVDGKWPDRLPPVTVFYNGYKHYVPDGVHRVLAAKKAGCAEVLAEIRRGSKEDAMEFACGANASHGLRRTDADNMNAAKIMRKAFPKLDADKIAETTGIGLDEAKRLFVA